MAARSQLLRALNYVANTFGVVSNSPAADRSPENLRVMKKLIVTFAVTLALAPPL